MKKLMQQFRRVSRSAQALILILAAAALSLILEIGVFHFSYFTQNQDRYPETEIDLSSMDGWNGEALPLLPENPTVSFDNLSVPARSVTIRTAGPSGVLSGNVGICDEASAYKTVGAGSFQVNPGGAENTVTVRLQSHGTLSRLRVTFTDALTEPVFLLSVTLNERQPLAVNGLRLLLMAFSLSALFLIVHFRIYRREYQFGRLSYRLMNLGVLLLCLLICGGTFYAQNADHSLLRPYPTLEEIRSPEMVVDAYMQQLDAFEKGQIALDLDVNPQLAALNNPYDTGERDKKEVAYHWDRAYYNGKYYSYFGLAPLFMVYYPVFWLTGMLPTTAFAGLLLSVFAVVMIFAAVHALIRLFTPRANLLLLLAGELAVVCGSFLYLMQASSSSFYYLPLIAAAGWLAAFTALASLAFLACRPAAGPVSHIRKRVLLFFLCGVSLVMLVLSRPNMALLAAAFAAPLFLRILIDKSLSWRQRLLESACPFLIPVLVGAAAVMYYNYIRFDSVFEFGQRYCTGIENFLYNKFYFSFDLASSMFYLFFVQGFQQLKDFPFFWLARSYPGDFGNYQYGDFYLGLLGVPVWYGLFLLVVLYMVPKQLRLRGGQEHQPISHIQAASRENVYGLDREWLLKVTLTTLLVILPVICYLQFQVAAFTLRYMMENLVAFAALNVVLLCRYVHFEEGMPLQSKLAYVIALYFLVATVVMEFFAPYSYLEQDFPFVNPDGLVAAKEFFTPLTTVH